MFCYSGLQATNKNGSLSSQTFLTTKTNTLDLFNPRSGRTKKRVTTAAVKSRRNQENLSSMTSHIKKNLIGNSSNLRRGSLKPLKAHISTDQKYSSSLNLVPKETENSGDAVIDGKQESCLTEKQKGSAISGSSPFHNLNLSKKAKVTSEHHSLTGVVASVDILTEKENSKEDLERQLESLGATVEKKVTPCFFQEGKMSTHKQASDWKVPLVSALWVEACKAHLRPVPLKGYEPHEMEKLQDGHSLYLPQAKIRRTVTGNKESTKPRRRTANSGETTRTGPPLLRSSKIDELNETVHREPNDLNKSTHQFQKISTSPIFHKRGSKPVSTSPRLAEKESSEDNEKGQKQKKNINVKLISASSSEGNYNRSKTHKTPSVNNSSMNDSVNSCVNEIRVLHGSQVYTKKEASASAPTRLLTSSKCKRLFPSCQKVMENKVDSKSNAGLSTVIISNMSQSSKIDFSCFQGSDKETGVFKTEKDSPGTKKRKLMNASQVIEAFEQDSCESISDCSDVSCPYQTSLKNKRVLKNSKRKFKNLKQKSNGVTKIEMGTTSTKKRKLMNASQVIEAFEQDSCESISDCSDVSCPYLTSPKKEGKTGIVKAEPMIPVLSDWEGDDNPARAAWCESTALFFKKETKVKLSHQT